MRTSCTLEPPILVILSSLIVLPTVAQSAETMRMCRSGERNGPEMQCLGDVCF